MDKKWEQDSKRFNDITRCSQKCSCGHSVMITGKNSKTVCNWCGKYVFKNKKEEFEYRMREKLKKKVI